MSKLKSIAVISCYMGKFPWYFAYFLHTCGYNPSVNFIIVCDDTSFDGKIPPNVRLIYMNLLQVGQLAAEKLGFPISIKNAYKLCDFKPAYGVIFEKYLTGYDFWAHSDIDIIFGNIRYFIVESILDCYDIISVRHDFLSGYFLLFRNNRKMNSLFAHSKDYKKVFMSDEHHCFDETNHIHAKFTEALDNGLPQHEIPSKIDSMTHVVRRMEFENLIRPYFDLHVVEGCQGRIKWKEGRVFYKGQYELLLYHMILFKKIYRRTKMCKHLPLEFNISPSRIYHRH